MEVQIRDRIYSLIADGVEKFPLSTPTSLACPEHKQELSELSCSDISNCSLCPLEQTRKRVVMSKNFIHKRFFILSEFPEQEDELSSSVFSEKSSNGLILKLSEKLKIQNAAHFSFALKCFPERGFPQGALTICSKNNLKRELLEVKPEIILAFGQRALTALMSINKANVEYIEENNSQVEMQFDGFLSRVFFLSASRELQLYPHWRAQVWRFLEGLKVNKD
jgi:uracil-DNA glycosylase